MEETRKSSNDQPIGLMSSKCLWPVNSVTLIIQKFQKIGFFWEIWKILTTEKIQKQDSRLAPAHFSQEYKYFDQHLPKVNHS